MGSHWAPPPRRPPMSTRRLQRTRASSQIETYLRPSLRGPGSALTDAVPRLAAGELIVIRDAFEPDFAERMYRSLDRCTAWRVYEGYEENFHYHHHNLYHPEEYPADLAWCSKIFGSSRTKEWVTRLSGRSCVGPAQFSASWYLPGDHSLPHNDIAESGESFDRQVFNRQVAFVWHLAKDWRSEWGGALYWCARACYLPPVFNTLLLFNVGPESNHFVTHVSPYAQGKRLAINGWWTGPAATGGRRLERTRPNQRWRVRKSRSIEASQRDRLGSDQARSAKLPGRVNLNLMKRHKRNKSSAKAPIPSPRQRANGYRALAPAPLSRRKIRLVWQPSRWCSHLKNACN